MKKSQELDNKIQDLNQLKSKYSPETNPKIRYYSPTPTRVFINFLIFVLSLKIK